MRSRFVGGLAAVLCFSLCIAAAPAATEDGCWPQLFRAIEHNAASPHSRFISYGEAIHITQDGHPYERAYASIVYRDDGIAYVDDDRWVHPFLSGVLEPGPPVLGPYGAHRSSWLSLIGDREDRTSLPVIADTHNPESGRCVDKGDTTIDGARVAHFVLPDAPLDRPSLKEIWLDRSTLEVRRAVVSQALTFVYDYQEIGKQRLIDYTIQMGKVDGYEVVRQIDWQYTYPVYGQFSTISAEFEFSGFQFTNRAPDGTLFATLQKEGL